MRRLPALVTVTATAVLASPVALAAGGVAASVSPRAGGPTAVFRVEFTAPDAAGHQGVFERSYSVRLVAARGQGCTRVVTMDVVKAAKGERVRLAFRGRLPWCAGRGHGAISETTGPYCPRKSDPCPEFPTRTQTIARLRFSVR